MAKQKNSTAYSLRVPAAIAAAIEDEGKRTGKSQADTLRWLLVRGLQAEGGDMSTLHGTWYDANGQRHRELFYKDDTGRTVAVLDDSVIGQYATLHEAVIAVRERSLAITTREKGE